MKNSTIKFSLLIAFLFSNNLFAQVEFYDETRGEYVSINRESESMVIQKFLKAYGGTAIEFNDQANTAFPIRIKNKKGNWMLYSTYDEGFFMEKAARKYSFEFPSYDNTNLLIAERKKNYYLVNIEESKIYKDTKFDQILVRIKNDTVYNYNEDYVMTDQTIYKVVNGWVVEKEGKWGLLETDYSYLDGRPILSHNYLYDSPAKVPESRNFDTGQLGILEELREKYDLDQLISLDVNGYKFKGRSRKSKKYGYYVGEGVPNEMIPPIYDDIIIKEGRDIFIVVKDGKYGYYNGNCLQVFAPEYDDAQYIHLDYFYGCALKNEGKWTLHDCTTGKLLIDQSADTTEQLVELWLDR